MYYIYDTLPVYMSIGLTSKQFSVISSFTKNNNNKKTQYAHYFNPE